MSQVDQDMAAAVKAVTRKYTRRCWWADEDDVRQEAWLHAHRARRGISPTGTVPTRDPFDARRSKSGDIKPLVRLAAGRHVQRLLLRDSAPVSASDHKRHELRGIKRAPVESLEFVGVGARPVDVERVRAKVIVRLRELVGDRMAWELLAAEGTQARGAAEMPDDQLEFRDEEEEELRQRLWKQTLKRLAKDEELRKLYEEIR